MATVLQFNPIDFTLTVTHLKDGLFGQFEYRIYEDGDDPEEAEIIPAQGLSTGGNVYTIFVNRGYVGNIGSTWKAQIRVRNTDNQVSGWLLDSDVAVPTAVSVPEAEGATPLSDYVLVDGTRAMTNDWDIGPHELRAQTFESDVTTGTAPFVVASTTKVTNLNVDLLDGQSHDYYVDADNLLVDVIGSPTYTSIQDWVDLTQSAGLLAGGGFTDNTDGSMTVAAGTGFVKTTDSAIGISVLFDWAEDTSVSLTDDSLNYIYIAYNAGSPTVNATVTKADISHTHEFSIGHVYRDGTTLHLLPGGTQVFNLGRRTQERFGAVSGFDRASGMATGETGTRNISITEGRFFLGLNDFTTAAFDSSGADSFTYWYRDGGGGWTSVAAQSAINNTQYDDGDGTLGTLSANHYGVHWVYIHEDSDVHVIYGQDNYKAGEVIDAIPPATIPTLVSSMGVLIARIIIKKNDAAFTSISYPWDVSFETALVEDHNQLSNLQGGVADEYYHLEAAEHTELHAWLDDVTLSDGGDVDLGTGDITAALGTFSGTVQAEHLYSTDDAVIADDLTVGGDLLVTGDFSLIGAVFSNHIGSVFQIVTGNNVYWYKIGQLSGNGARIQLETVGQNTYGSPGSQVTRAVVSHGNEDNERDGWRYTIGDDPGGQPDIQYKDAGVFLTDVYLKAGPYFAGSVEIVAGISFTINGSLLTPLGDPSATAVDVGFIMHSDVTFLGDIIEPLIINASDDVNQGQLTLVDADQPSTNVASKAFLTGYGSDISGATGKLWYLGSASSTSHNVAFGNLIADAGIYITTVGTGGIVLSPASAGVNITTSLDIDVDLNVDGSAVVDGSLTLGEYIYHQGNPETYWRFEADSIEGATYSVVGFALATNLTLSPAGDVLFDPAGNDVLPVTGYDLNLGSLQKKYLTLHAAELWVETLVAQDTIATIGGRVLVGPTTVLTSDLGDGAGDTTITVKHNQMASGDRVYMEADGKVEFMSIDSAPGGAGPYTYTVTRNLDASGRNLWYAGDAAFNTGTTGDGFIDLYSYAGVTSGTTGPTIVGNVRNSATYNDWTEHWAIGNLDGLYGYGVTTYGLGLGEYSTTTAYITIDSTDGYRIHGGDQIVAVWDNDGDLFFFDDNDAERIFIGDFVEDTDYGIKITNHGGVWLQSGQTTDTGGWALLLDDVGDIPSVDTFNRTGMLVRWGNTVTDNDASVINAQIGTAGDVGGYLSGATYVIGAYDESPRTDARHGVFVNLQGYTSGVTHGIHSIVYAPDSSGTVYAGYFNANQSGGGGLNPAGAYGIYADGVGGALWAAGHVVLANGSDILLETDAGSDLGATGNRFDNLFVDDITVTTNVTLGGTLEAEHLYSTDDAVIDGFATIGETLEVTDSLGVGGTPPATTAGRVLIQDTTLDTTVGYKGLRVNIIKTAGATGEADDLYGAHINAEMNDADSTIGHLTGIWVRAYLNDGTVGDDVEDVIAGYFLARMDAGTLNDDIIGNYIETDVNTGTVTGNVYGIEAVVGIAVGMTAVGGDVFGVSIRVDDDKGATGTIYMLYLDELTGVDYGIYQDGTADNYFGGNITSNLIIQAEHLYTTDDLVVDGLATIAETLTMDGNILANDGAEQIGSSGTPFDLIYVDEVDLGTTVITDGNISGVMAVAANWTFDGNILANDGAEQIGSSGTPFDLIYVDEVDLGTNTITDGNLTGAWTGITNLTASGTVQAEHLYSTDDIQVDDDVIMATGGKIRTATSDGSDNAVLYLTSADIAGSSRGAYVAVHGNEHGQLGQLWLVAGNIAGGAIDMHVGGDWRGKLDEDGLFWIDGDIEFDSGTAFGGKFAHANTVDRVWTFPDKSGTVAMIADVDTPDLWIPLGPYAPQGTVPTTVTGIAVALSYVTNNYNELAAADDNIGTLYKARVRYVYDDTHATLKLSFAAWKTGTTAKTTYTVYFYVDGVSKASQAITATTETNDEIEWTIAGLTTGNGYELQMVITGTTAADWAGGVGTEVYFRHNPKKTMFFANAA